VRPAPDLACRVSTGRSQADCGEPGFQQGEGAPGGIGPAEPGPDAHDLLAEGIVVGVGARRGFQGGQGVLGVARLEDADDAGQGVDGAADLLGVARGGEVGDLAG
jgi:hypothetical protein